MALTSFEDIAYRLDDAATALAGLVRLGRALADDHEEALAYQLVCLLKPLATAVLDASVDLQDVWVLHGHYLHHAEETMP